MIIGIYKITNLVNKKIYIGSSIDIKARWANHKSQLKKGTHKSPHLQSAWNKYGEENFEFEIIEHVLLPSYWPREERNEKLLIREQFHLDNSRCLEREFGYNTRPRADRKLHSEETKERMRKPKPEGFGDARRGEKNSFYGKKHSEETKEKIRRIQTGRPHPEKWREKSSETLKGRKFSEEHKENLSKPKVRLSDSRKAELCRRRDEENLSQPQLAKMFGIGLSTVNVILNKWRIANGI